MNYKQGREVLNRPAGLDELDKCPSCKKNKLQYNPYHHWESCWGCGYMKKNVFK